MNITLEPHCELVKVVLLFNIGRFHESKRGLVQSTVDLMKKETEFLSNQALQAEIDRYGMSIDIYSSPLFITCEMHCHKLFVYQAIDLFFQVVFSAKFSENQWQIVQNQIIENIIQNQNQTNFQADKILSEHIFQDLMPLGYYSEPIDYKEITTLEIENFYKENIQLTRPQLYLAGDIDSELESVIEEKLNHNKFHQPKTIAIPSSPISEVKILSKKLVDSSQSSVRLGKIIPKSSFQDFIELEILNTYLGGFYLSELMKSLRINHGYTYGVYSYLIHFPEFSFFQISYETDFKNIEPSISAIKKLFDRLINEKNIDFTEAKKQYYSQFSKNIERSLYEVMYKIRVEKLGYNYLDYKNEVENHQSISIDKFKTNIFDYKTYSQSIVS